MIEKDLTRDEKIELENQAIESLLQYGVKFSVPLKIKPRGIPKLIELWNRLFPSLECHWKDRRIPQEWDVEKIDVLDIYTNKKIPSYMRVFTIKPLYLGTIDMIQKIKLDISFDEKKIQENTSVESEKLMDNISTMAKMVSVAVLNCSEVSVRGSREVLQLQKFFMNHLTVNRLQKLSLIVDQMRNKAGFISSIRLMLKQETQTAPKADRVEK